MTRSYTVSPMAAIHPRFRDAMLERLKPRLVNARGSVAILSTDPVSSHELALGSASPVKLTQLDSQRWDTLVFIGELWRLSDLGSVREALSDDGRLFFVEPVMGFGLVQRSQSLCRPLVRRRLGLDFRSDLPQELRDVGLTPTSVDRFQVGGPLFTFAAGEARSFAAELPR